MPDLKGWLATSATAALQKVGIKAAPVDYIDVPIAPVGSGNAAPAPPVKPGAVIAQSPVAGARVDQTTMVRLAAAR